MVSALKDNYKRAGCLVLQILLAGGLLAAAVFGEQNMQEWRINIRAAESKAQEAPRQARRAELSEASLLKNKGRIDAIEGLVLTPDRLTGMINQIEGLAKKYQLTMAIPTVAEVMEVDESGQPVARAGYLKPVQVKVVAEGDARQLTRFLHEMEHLPYLAETVGWELQLERSQTARAQGAGEGLTRQPSRLNADLKVFMKKDEE